MAVLRFPTPLPDPVRRHVYRLAFRDGLSVEAQAVLTRLREQLDRQRRGLVDVRYVHDARAGDWIVTELWDDAAPVSR